MALTPPGFPAKLEVGRDLVPSDERILLASGGCVISSTSAHKQQVWGLPFWFSSSCLGLHKEGEQQRSPMQRPLASYFCQMVQGHLPNGPSATSLAALRQLCNLLCHSRSLSGTRCDFSMKDIRSSSHELLWL